MYFFLQIKKQFLKVKKGGFIVFVKKTISCFLFIFQPVFYIVAIFLIIIIRIISPFYLIRWAELASSRIGHFAKEPAIIVLENIARINVPSQKYLDIFFFRKYATNKQLKKMWKRKLIIMPRWLMKPLAQLNDILPSSKKHDVVKINRKKNLSRDINSLLKQYDPILKFKNDEEIKGKLLLLELGIKKNNKFVCLAVRDSYYLSEREPSKDYGYHDYRNGEIEKFILAAEELANRGYNVIRMGSKVLKRLNTNNPMIIDYANLDIRSDFMDIYLLAKCDFCISTDYGVDEVCAIFKRPIAYVGVVPIGGLTTSDPNSLIIFKQHINKKTKKEITFREIFDHNLATAHEKSLFEKEEIILSHNTPEQIRDLAIEMDVRIKKDWKESKDEENLQKYFWLKFKENCKKNNFQNYVKKNGETHGDYHARIGTKYLEEKKNLIN